jgi:hypothetical protein
LDKEAQINSNTMVMGNFNTPLSPDKNSTKKQTLELNDTIDQMDLTNIYRMFI